MNDKSKTKEIETWINLLKFRTLKGWECFQISSKISRKYFFNDLLPKSKDSAFRFFSGIHRACEDYAILILVELTSRNSSVNIRGLLRHAILSPTLFNPNFSEDIKRDAEDHEKQLSDLNIYIKNLQKHRDNRIAHLGKDLINAKPSDNVLPPINVDSVMKEAYQKVARIIGTYSYYFGISKSKFDFVDGLSSWALTTEKDVEYFVNLVKPRN